MCSFKFWLQSFICLGGFAKVKSGVHKATGEKVRGTFLYATLVNG